MAGVAVAEERAGWDTQCAPAPTTRLAFTRNKADAYSESISFSAEVGPNSSVGITFVVTNIGMGAGNGAVRSNVSLAGRKQKWNSEVDDWQQDAQGLSFDKSRVEIVGDDVHVVHRADDYEFDLTYRRKLPAWMPQRGRVVFGSSRDFYEFGLPMPVADVTGRVRIGDTWQDVNGWGQIDHSRTNCYPHEQATHWYRFRGYADGTLVQLTDLITPPKYGEQPVRWLLVAAGGKIAHASYDYQLALLERVVDPKRDEYRPALRYDVRDGERVVMTVGAPRVTSRTDYLESMGRLKRFIVSKYAKPVGYGLEGKFDARFQLPGVPKSVSGRAWMSQTFFK